MGSTLLFQSVNRPKCGDDKTKGITMAESTIWWLMAGSAVAVELVTGTFYLLMLAIGLASAALAAHLGASITFQFLSAAVVGGAAIVGWHLLRGRRPQGPGSAANPDLHLDVGETVQVDHWQADGTASVHYRGANWTVFHRPGVMPAPGVHRVAEVVGSRLMVDRV
jgi:membrane protein implicated in regulation of membrane protease activity